MYAKNKNDDDDVLKCILLRDGDEPAHTLPHNMVKKKYRTLKKKFCFAQHCNNVSITISAKMRMTCRK